MSDDRKSKNPPKDKSRRCIYERDPSVSYSVTCVPMEVFVRTPVCPECHWTLEIALPNPMNGLNPFLAYRCPKCETEHHVRTSDVGLEYRRAE